MAQRQPICDTCGEEDATTMRGDLAVCAACAAGEREDSRPSCPHCRMRVPHSYLLATWNDENIYEQTCPFCGYTWDETRDGRDAPLYAALRACASS